MTHLIWHIFLVVSVSHSKHISARHDYQWEDMKYKVYNKCFKNSLIKGWLVPQPPYRSKDEIQRVTHVSLAKPKRCYRDTFPTEVL